MSSLLHLIYFCVVGKERLGFRQHI
jgi:hypothetical protein